MTILIRETKMTMTNTSTNILIPDKKEILLNIGHIQEIMEMIEIEVKEETNIRRIDQKEKMITILLEIERIMRLKREIIMCPHTNQLIMKVNIKKDPEVERTKEAQVDIKIDIEHQGRDGIQRRGDLQGNLTDLVTMVGLVIENTITRVQAVIENTKDLMKTKIVKHLS
jgi:hypothetical protein